jgi:hypothetical protein
MARRTYVLTTQLRRRGVTAFVFVLIAAIFVIARVKRMLSRHARERVQEKYRSRQALVRYVQLRYQCSEEVAYQRVATFVKRHVPGDEWDSVEYMAAYDRQRLLELAQRILMHNPDEIDEI